MSDTTNLKINSVIGTGDPFDVIMVIPLIHDWGVPDHCVFCWGEGKEKADSKPISRLLCLAEEFAGNKVVGCCEEHYEAKCKPRELQPEVS